MVLDIITFYSGEMSHCFSGVILVQVCVFSDMLLVGFYANSILAFEAQAGFRLL